eukprot:4630914-Prymnesium_polylepis.1
MLEWGAPLREAKSAAIALCSLQTKRYFSSVGCMMLRRGDRLVSRVACCVLHVAAHRALNDPR